MLPAPFLMAGRVPQNNLFSLDSKLTFLIAKFRAFVVRCSALKRLAPKLISIRYRSRTTDSSGKPRKAA